MDYVILTFNLLFQSMHRLAADILITVLSLSFRFVRTFFDNCVACHLTSALLCQMCDRGNSVVLVFGFEADRRHRETRQTDAMRIRNRKTAL